MKKALSLLILSIVLVISACEKTEYVVPNRTIVTLVNPGDWRSTNGGRSYEASIDMPEIDEYFNENGAAIVFVSFGEVPYEQIPQVFKGVSYRYSTRPGQIVLSLESATGEGTINPPGDAMDVKIILIDSQ